MHFELNQEQQQLADAVRRWIGRDYGFETRRAIVHSTSGVSPDAWATMTELGLTALPVPEERGGFGGDALAMFAVMQELGRGLVVEPYMATVLGAEFLRLGSAQAGHGALLERVAAGEFKLACALGERQSRHDAFDIATRADAVDGGYRLHGEKRVVVHGAEADALIVSARSAGAVGEGQGMDGVSLFVVPRDSAGLRVTAYRTLDGLRAADVALDGVVVGRDAVIGRVEEGGAILDAALDYAAGLLCAEALGAMEALFDM
ncbi:MAG: pimeloyl-CoA dehydrogenase small subunit, partial [Candidatus Accumulibacter sp.]|nr:pimeloyl-CoA dehydrogenase small subunit [Accumulibacter sp.]